MSDDEEDIDLPEDLSFSDVALRLAAHPSKAVQAVGWVIFAKTALAGRRWAQINMADFQGHTGYSRSTVRRALEAGEADRVIDRIRRKGKPAAGQARGDYYTPALSSKPLGTGPRQEEAAPTRAGPTKEQPDEVPSPPGCQIVSETPDRAPKQARSKQP